MYSRKVEYRFCTFVLTRKDMRFEDAFLLRENEIYFPKVKLVIS